MATAVRATAEERRRVFPITLLHYVTGRPVAGSWPPPGERLFETDVPEQDESFQFTLNRVGDEAALRAELDLLLVGGRTANVVVVSDALAERSGEAWHPTPLVESIRARFRNGPHLAALVAVVKSDPARVHDVDVTVAADAGRSAMLGAVIRAATAVRLKAPPAPGAPKPPDSLRVEVVQSRDVLWGCLALRRRVYGILGYLPDLVMNDPSGLEMDCYDPGSIHFVARVGDEVVGTARLALGLPREQKGPADPGDPDPGASLFLDEAQRHTRKTHQQWCLELSKFLGKEPPSIDPAGPRTRLPLDQCVRLRNRVQENMFGPLPILQSSDFNRTWGPTLKRVSPACELSRLVVAPAWRGRKISGLLVRAVLAKAFQLKRRTVLLECIPTHVPLYKKFAFSLMAGDPHSRPSDLDQFAVGMWLRFDQKGPAVDTVEMLLASILFGKANARNFGPIDVPMG